MQPFPATGATHEVSASPDVIYPVWSAGGKELITRNGMELDIVSVTTSPALAFGNPASMPGRNLKAIGPTASRTFDVMPDGRFIGMTTAATSQPSHPDAQTIHVVLNWFDELKARVK